VPAICAGLPGTCCCGYRQHIALYFSLCAGALLDDEVLSPWLQTAVNLSFTWTIVASASLLVSGPLKVFPP
jgi:hypothetical protein